MKDSLDFPATFLYSFLILGTSIFIGMIYSRTSEVKVKENFAAPPPAVNDANMRDITLQSCPAQTTSFTTNGITKCCNGDIVNNKCNGTEICALSSSTDLPSCQELLRKSLQEKAVQSCPASLPRYFEDKEKPNRQRNEKPKTGCTASARTPDGKSVIDSAARKCFIYPTRNENLENTDSCYNIRIAEAYKCPSTGKPAQIVNLGNGTILHSCSFVGTATEQVNIVENAVQTPRTRIGGRLIPPVQRTIRRTTTRTITKPVTCYSELSYNAMLLKNKTPLSGLTTKEDLLNFCSVANQYYIQKSINDQSFSIANELTKLKNNLQSLITSEEKKYA